MPIMIKLLLVLVKVVSCTRTSEYKNKVFKLSGHDGQPTAWSATCMLIA